MSYEILTNNDDLDIQSLIQESLIFFGERHGHSKDMNVVRKIIEYVEPDYIIVEVLADLILDNKRAKEKALKLDEKDLFYERLTMMWIELASDSVTIIYKLPKEECITVKIFTDESGNKVTREVTYSTIRKDYTYKGRKSFRKIVTVT